MTVTFGENMMSTNGYFVTSQDSHKNRHKNRHKRSPVLSVMVHSIGKKDRSWLGYSQTSCTIRNDNEDRIGL